MKSKKTEVHDASTILLTLVLEQIETGQVKGTNIWEFVKSISCNQFDR